MTPSRSGRTEVVAHVDLGTAEFVPDPKRAHGWVLMVDGVAQSYVDLADPRHLEFSYVRQVATVIDALGRPGAPVDALHLGGGGLTLARYVEASRPGSRQRVVERDRALSTLVGQVLPLPSGIDVTIDITDARTAVETGPTAAYDLVISDAYHAARMPVDVTSTEFVAYVATTLRPDGVYVANVTDLPALAFTRVQAATLREVFADVCVLAEPGMLRGRRFGNIVLAASTSAGGLPIQRLRALARTRDDTASGRLLHGADLDIFIGGAHPTRDASTGGRQPMLSSESPVIS